MGAFVQLTLAVAVSMLVIPVAWRLAPRLGLVDMPDDPRKVHTVPIPRVGGWGITLGTLLPIVLVFKLDPLVLSLVIGSLTLFAFGIWDDARTIGHWPKFLGQLIATGIVVYYGGLYVSHVPFFDGPISPLIGKPFTMFAMVGVINAINHSDGLDGLAGGESMLSLIALAILGYLSGSALMVSLTLTTIGGILGFLRYNSHPANVFMGDCGSQVLGFMLGFQVVYLTQTANTALSAALPLLLLGLPIADIISVLVRRVRAGQNWFKATRNHVHHRLLELGFDHYETVVIIYSIQAASVVCAVLARYESDLSVTLLYAALVGSLFVALSLAERSGWRVPRGVGTSSALIRTIARLKASGRLSRTPLVIITAVTPAVMALSSLWVRRVPGDFAVAAAVLAVAVAVELSLQRGGTSVLVRMAIYATAIFSAYLFIHYPGFDQHAVERGTLGVMVLLAVAIAMYMRFSADTRFGTTPTDYLIVCGVLALAVLGSIEITSRSLVELVFIATVLMYGCEIIIDCVTSRRVLHFSALGTLLVIAVRGIL